MANKFMLGLGQCTLPGGVKVRCVCYGAIILCSYVFYICSYFFLLRFFPRLLSAVTDRVSTILLHMMWP